MKFRKQAEESGAFDSTSATREVLQQAVQCANQLARTADEFLKRIGESLVLPTGSQAEFNKLKLLQVEMVTLAGRLHVALDVLEAPEVVAEAWRAVGDAESGLDAEETGDGTA